MYTLIKIDDNKLAFFMQFKSIADFASELARNGVTPSSQMRDICDDVQRQKRQNKRRELLLPGEFTPVGDDYWVMKHFPQECKGD